MEKLFMQFSSLPLPFKLGMKFLFVFLFAMPAFAQSVQFEMTCANNQCNSVDLTNSLSTCAVKNNASLCEEKVSGNLCFWIEESNVNGGYCTSQPQDHNCIGYDCPVGKSMSVVRMRGVMSKDVSVISTAAGAPQNLGISFNNGAYPGKNANIAIGSQNSSSIGASLILIGDNFNNLNISLDGHSGKKGASVAEICATRVKNGDYGLPLQNYFNERRSQTSADPNRCDAADLNYMQSFNFKCDDDGYTEVSTTNPVVTVSQIKKQARCNAIASYSYCVNKKVEVTCNFKVWSSFRQAFLTGSELQPGVSQIGGVATMPLLRTKTLPAIDESLFISEKSRLGGIDGYCQIYGRQARSGAEANAWWGGTGNPALAQAHNGNGTESEGIPSELISGTPAHANWAEETATTINGGYDPITNIFGSGYYTKAAYWKANGSTSAVTAPGLNPDGITLAAGSLWQVMQSNYFEVCPAGWTSQKELFVNLVQYTNKENTSCSGINDPQDPNDRAFWQYTGEAQLTSFGTENVSCGIGSCAVGSTVSELTHALDKITPESGEDGTEQGRGLVFVYDIFNLDAHALPGGAGALGELDVNVNSQTRICAKVDDATAGINTEQAKTPFVSFRRYDWQVIRSVSGGNPGSSPQNTGKSVEVFKKLDPSVRYLLEKSLL